MLASILARKTAIWLIALKEDNEHAKLIHKKTPASNRYGSFG
jgi:hypothetical protein